MTRLNLIAELQARRTGIGHREATMVVNALFDAMAEALERGERIELRGFGTFGVIPRAARRGRNPRTGAAVAVAAKRVPFFRVGKELRAEIQEVRAELSNPPQGTASRPARD
jgi:integration host factor subunit beta